MTINTPAISYPPSQATNLRRQRDRERRRAERENPEKRAKENARRIELAKRDPEKTRAAHAVWRKNNPEKLRALSRAKHAKRAQTMDDRYIATLIARSGCSLLRTDIPQSLIDLKREHLRLTRQLKESSQS